MRKPILAAMTAVALAFAVPAAAQQKVKIGFISTFSGPQGVMAQTHGMTRDWPKAFAVASAYELGRSFAVASRVGYERRRRGAAA